MLFLFCSSAVLEILLEIERCLIGRYRSVFYLHVCAKIRFHTHHGLNLFAFLHENTCRAATKQYWMLQSTAMLPLSNSSLTRVLTKTPSATWVTERIWTDVFVIHVCSRRHEARFLLFLGFAHLFVGLFILSFFCDAHIHATIKFGITALILAARYARDPVVKMLLEAGANKDAKDCVSHWNANTLISFHGLHLSFNQLFNRLFANATGRQNCLELCARRRLRWSDHSTWAMICSSFRYALCRL